VLASYIQKRTNGTWGFGKMAPQLARSSRAALRCPICITFYPAWKWRIPIDLDDARSLARVAKIIEN